MLLSLIHIYWPFFAAMNANPQVMRFFPGVMTEKDSLAMWNRIRKELDEIGYGLYAVEWKHSGSLIGLLGFHWADFEADFTPVSYTHLDVYKRQEERQG